jgi:hypothetical protein
VSRPIVLWPLLVLAALGGCATADWNLSGASRHLEQGMTESQVTALLGSEPHSVSLNTCGSATPNPWQCKQYKYSNGWGASLFIRFEQGGDSVWRVNSWDSY